MQDEEPTHFKGKDAVGHVAEAQAMGVIASTEIHGTELPGYLSAATDAARDTAIALLLLSTILIQMQCNIAGFVTPFLILSAGWILWKGGRGAWLGWSRLERLHRVLEEERWEIEHHRDQEREELSALYAAKGFEGKLLEDVIDVLMADGDRLLRVMVEEELGLTLEALEHPLQQGLGAAMGALIAAGLCLAGYFAFGPMGFGIAAFTTVALSAAIASRHIGNRLLPAVVWNIGIASLSFGAVYFFMQLAGASPL